MRDGHEQSGLNGSGGGGDVPAWVESSLPRGFGVEDLLAYVEGELAEGRVSVLVNHLAEKPEFQAWVNELRADRVGVRSLGPDGELTNQQADARAHGGLVASAMAMVEPEAAATLAFQLTEPEAVPEDFVDIDFVDTAAGGRPLAPSLEPTRAVWLTKRSVGMLLSGMVAGAAMVTLGVGLGLWLANGLTEPRSGLQDDSAYAMAPELDEARPGASVGRALVVPERDDSASAFGRESTSDAAVQADELDGSSAARDRNESIAALADSITDELASRGATSESFTDRPQEVIAPAEGVTPVEPEERSPIITRRDVVAQPGERGRDGGRVLLASEAADLAEIGLLEIEIVRDRQNRRSIGIERHAALTAGGVTIAALRGEDPDQAAARDAALHRLKTEGRLQSRDPFVYLVELEPTTRRLDRLKSQLEEQTGGRVRFVEAGRVMEPSREARIWLWTGERVDLRGMSRFPLFVIIED